MTHPQYHLPRRRYGHGAAGLALDAAIAGTSWTWRNRQPLAPLVGAALAAPSALVAHGLAQIPGATPYVVAGEVAAIAAATGMTLMQRYSRPLPGHLSTVVIGGSAIWASIDPWQAHPWGVMAVGAVACQAAWWVGRAMVTHDPTARLMRRGERLVADARWDGHVAAVSRVTGAVEWRISLGTGTRAGSIRLADVAHILAVTPDRVHVWPGETSREVTIRLMDRRPSRRPTRHPALVAATRDEWAPGVRSIVDPIPVAPSPAGLADPVMMSPRPDGDVMHLLVAGMTGSGKSYSLASLLTGIMACRDVILAGSDIPKSGQTLAPFEPAFARVTGTLADLRADLEALEALSQARIRRMTAIHEDKWDPAEHGPLIVYVIEEWAATVSMATDKKSPDAEAAAVVEMVDRLAATVRSAGISLLIATQRPDRESMGSTRLRSNLASLMVHKVRKRADLLGLPEAEDMDLSALSRQGDAYISCGSAGLTRGRAYAVPPRDRVRLAERYADRPGVHPDDAEILRAAGWRVTIAEADDVFGRPARTSGDETAPAPAEDGWVSDTLADIDALPAVTPPDAPADVVLYVLTEALGDADRITITDALAALGWGDDAQTRQRLAAAVTEATGGRVRSVQRRVPGTTDRTRVYLRTDLAEALAQVMGGAEGA